MTFKDELKRREEESRIIKAGELAEDIIDALKLGNPPFDPFVIAENDLSQLSLIGGNFSDCFDGQLEYHTREKRFLLFYNTKYNQSCDLGIHHPRTRFSVAHELGHFYLDTHRAFLMRTGQSHGSKSEFRSDVMVEREADSFAANLLMPKNILAPIVNKGELNISRLKKIADLFQTSLVSTTINCVKVSHFPCAIVAIYDNRIIWQFLSESLIEGGCYPGLKGQPSSQSAQEQWNLFMKGKATNVTCESLARKWFRLYSKTKEDNLWVIEHYLPVPIMNTLLVLITISEKDLFNLE